MAVIVVVIVVVMVIGHCFSNIPKLVTVEVLVAVASFGGTVALLAFALIFVITVLVPILTPVPDRLFSIELVFVYMLGGDDVGLSR